MKKNFLNKVPKKNFFRKKIYWKNSFRKNISKLIFFTNSILEKNFTKIFLKNSKQILEIFILIFKKLRKKNRTKKSRLSVG